MARKNRGYDGLNDRRFKYSLTGTSWLLIGAIVIALLMLIIFSFVGNLHTHVVIGPIGHLISSSARPSLT